MNPETLLTTPAAGWAVAALLLALAEVLAPGFSLIWLALAAGVTAVASLVFGLPLEAGFALFAVAAVASVFAGRRLLAASDRGLPDDPFINEAPARLVGREVVVVDPITGGEGRVRLGDTTWLARGPDLPAGARARVRSVEGGILRVEERLPPTPG